MKLTRIVAVVVDDSAIVTLYRSNGETIEIAKSDPRIRRILDTAVPEIETNGFADVDLNLPNVFRDYEEMKDSVVRFFRVAKRFVNDVLVAVNAPETEVDIAPVTAGTVPSSKTPMASAVDAIMARGTSVSSDKFSDADTTSDDTIVAVVGDTVIPGAEQLKEHVGHSVKLQSSKGFEAFMKRISKVIANRKHSVEDLLRFMEKNDLPIADDGSLIVYKVLRRSGDHYVDCHTRKVHQRIGSFVCVDPKLIDQTRTNECSAGLHVARRGYIGGFGGDVCTVVKVAPEDVWVVPHRDPNKVRVAGYHILMELPKDAWELLQRNTPMTSNPKAQAILGRAVTGEHVGIIERVEIGGHKGTNVTVTPVENGKKKTAKKVAPAVALDDETIKTAEEKVDENQVRKDVDKLIKITAKGGSARQLKAQSFVEVLNSSTDDEHRRKAAQELMAFKKSAKVSWGTLGVDDATVALIQQLTTGELPQVSIASVEPAPTVVGAEPAPVEPGTPAPSGFNRKALAAQLAEKVLKQDKEAALQLLTLKKKSKVSWETLGISSKIQQLAEKLAR